MYLFLHIATTTTTSIFLSIYQSLGEAAVGDGPVDPGLPGLGDAAAADPLQCRLRQNRHINPLKNPGKTFFKNPLNQF